MRLSCFLPDSQCEIFLARDAYYWTGLSDKQDGRGDSCSGQNISEKVSDSFLEIDFWRWGLLIDRGLVG
jgi:hypothetical protein